MTVTAAAKAPSRARKWPWTRILRYAVQAVFVAILVNVALQHQIKGGHTGPTPPIDAYCPFGGIESAYRYIAEGQFLPKTALSSLVLLGGLILGVIVAGGAFCGWICPFGAVQDFLSGVRRRLKIPTVTVPLKVDHVLTYGRYLVLVLILYFSIRTSTLWFAGYDPFRAVFDMEWLFGLNWAANSTSYIITATVLLGSLLIPRFWCRYLCPLGGLISILQRVSLLKIERRPNVCIDCGRCAKACPMRLPVDKAIRTSTSCIGCLECVDSCPKKGALDVSFVLARPSEKPAA